MNKNSKKVTTIKNIKDSIVFNESEIVLGSKKAESYTIRDEIFYELVLQGGKGHKITKLPESSKKRENLDLEKTIKIIVSVGAVATLIYKGLEWFGFK